MSSSFNSDVRQLRNAVTLLIQGVLRDIDAGADSQAPHDTALQVIGDAIIAELDDWDYTPGQRAADTMATMLAAPRAVEP